MTPAEKGRRDGVECIATFEADGLVEILMAGRADVVMARVLAEAFKGAAETAATSTTNDGSMYAKGFVAGADDAITRLRAELRNPLTGPH